MTLASPGRWSIIAATILVAMTLSGCATASDDGYGTELQQTELGDARDRLRSGTAVDENGSPVYDDDQVEADLATIAQAEWEAQEGSTWDTFEEAYHVGYYGGCQDMFLESPDGFLYAAENQLDELDCDALTSPDASIADLPVDVPVDPDAYGEALGRSDGCETTFEELGDWGSLYWGEDEYTDLDCPSAP